MSSKVKNTEQKSVIELLRKIRDEMSLEIMDMDKRELKEYFAKKRLFYSKKYKPKTDL